MPEGEILTEFNKGSYFGQLALSQPQKTRSAAIYTTSDCLLITIDKQNFQQLILFN
jgi:CRP-like cAMP-binding protein